jgi:CBS domain-containing protein
MVRDLMSTKLVTLHPKDKMQRVKELFEAYNVHHIPIIVGDSIVGLISKSDFHQIKGISKNSYDEFIKDKIFKTHPIEDYMNNEVVCCDPETPISGVIDLFLVNEIHCVPVVEKGKLVGIITPVDLLKAMKDLVH